MEIVQFKIKGLVTSTLFQFALENVIVYLLRLRVEKVFIAILLLGFWRHHGTALHFVEALSRLMYILFYWSAPRHLTIRFF